VGRVELVDEHEHPAGWIQLPDASSPSGWVDHAVPLAAARPARRRLGFGAAHER
jgi:hypothetical protein